MPINTHISEQYQDLFTKISAPVQYGYAAPESLNTVYEGQIATRCGCNDAASIGNYFWDQATVHQAMSTVYGIRPMFANFYVTTATGDTVTNLGKMEVYGTIEYPNNVFTQITFEGGKKVGDVPIGGISDTDMIPVYIPKGEWFRLKIHGHNAGAIPVASTLFIPVAGFGATLLDGITYAVGTDVADKTSLANATYATNILVNKPFLITAITDQPSLAITGDSIAHGQYDTEDATHRTGHMERACTVGYTNLARMGETVLSANTAGRYASRKLAAPYITHVDTNYGTNDITANRTGAAIVALINTWYAANFPGKPFCVNTLTPRSTGTWDNLTGQTLIAQDAELSNLNDLILAGKTITAQTSVLDVHNIIANTYSENYWKFFGAGKAITNDGVHPNPKGYQYIASKIDINKVLI